MVKTNARVSSVIFDGLLTKYESSCFSIGNQTGGQSVAFRLKIINLHDLRQDGTVYSWGVDVDGSGLMELG